MNWTPRRLALSFILPLLKFHLFCNADFEVKVPSAPLAVVHGQVAILNCSFPVDQAFDLDSIVITWQRRLEVVHSFYHGQDQLDLQSRRYVNRTRLYHSELGRGNASLRLDSANLGDVGEYTCSISTLTGSQKKTFPVKVTALYTEPRLQVSISPQEVQLKLTSRGYPTPKVRWLDGRGAEITDETQTELVQDPQGLYVLSSSLTQDRGANSSLTFILLNEEMEQEIRREFSLLSLQPDDGTVLPDEPNFALHAILPLGILAVLGILGILLFLWKRKKTHTEQEERMRKVPGLLNYPA